MSAYSLTAPAVSSVRFHVKGFSKLALAITKFGLSIRPTSGNGFKDYVRALTFLGVVLTGFVVMMVGLFLPGITVGLLIAGIASKSVDLIMIGTSVLVLTFATWRVKVSK